MRPAPFYRQGPKLKNVALLALLFSCLITNTLIQRNQGWASRAAFFNFGPLMALVFCLITYTVIQRNQGRASRAAFFNFGPLLVPVSWLTTIAGKGNQGKANRATFFNFGPLLVPHAHQSNIFQFWGSVGPLLVLGLLSSSY